MTTVTDVLQQAWQHHQTGNLDAAMQMYRGVLRQFPDSAEAWVYLGIGQFDQRDFTGSVDSYRRAVAIRDLFPIAWNNMGNSLRMLGQIDEAESCFEKALRQQPGYLSALKNRGTLWVWNGEVERGLHWYQQGLQIDPNNAELHRNLGVISLLMGDYARGFDEFRWRWRMPGVARPAIASFWQQAGIRVPVWSGQPLENRTIVIYPEQGLGDAIHFIRVAAALKASGAHVIVVCSERLIPLFSSVPGIDEWVAETGGTLDGTVGSASMIGGNLTQADYQGSFLEILDGLFQRDGKLYHGEELFSEITQTDDDQRRGRCSGYLEVPEDSIVFWRNWLREARGSSTKPVIGLNWQGNREHHADVYRSVSLDIFAPLVESQRFDAVSLQFGQGSEQLDQVDFARNIIRLPESLDRAGGQFMDTAAVLCSLDALVTTDTAIAHLAGALGVRTHLLLGRVPDWRWLMRGERTGWYPNTRISRQTEFGQWSAPVQTILEQLSLVVKASA